MWDPNPGDLVRIKYDGEFMTGTFKGDWGHPEDDHGMIIQHPNGYEEWIDLRDIEGCEVISRKDASG